MSSSLERRARIHAALGEPIRLAIVDELALSDRSPGELARRFSLPTNLLAHHLDVLGGADLVERVVSSGDRRRRYVRLRPEGFDIIGANAGAPPEQVVFVCTRNSARSQLAAAIWTSRTGGAATSAGTDPADRVDPGAIAAAHRHGFDLGEVEPRRLGPVDTSTRLITVCDRAHEDLDPAHASWHWSLPDPVEVGTDEAFDTTIHALDDRITHLVPRQETP